MYFDTSKNLLERPPRPRPPCEPPKDRPPENPRDPPREWPPEPPNERPPENPRDPPRELSPKRELPPLKPPPKPACFNTLVLITVCVREAGAWECEAEACERIAGA